MSAGTDCALLVLDVDHFKRINDSHGGDSRAACSPTPTRCTAAKRQARDRGVAAARLALAG